MERFAPLGQDRIVGDLLGERMLENVLHFKKCRLLVEELFVLEGGNYLV